MPLEFEYSFGFNPGKHSVAFYDENSVVVLAGRRCILHDLEDGLQRSFSFVDRGDISAVIRVDTFLLASVRSRPASICSFRIVSEKKKTFHAPEDVKSREFVCMSLSKSRTMVAGQTGGPEWKTVVWLCRSREPLAVLRPCQASGTAVDDMSFSLCGTDELVLVGEGVFKMYERRSDAGEGDVPFAEYAFESLEKGGRFRSIAWPQNEYLAVGSSEGKILFFRGVELINDISVFAQVEHLLGLVDAADANKLMSTQAVTSISVASGILTCLLSGVGILVYHGDEVVDYKFTKYVLLPPNNPCPKDSSKDFFINAILSPRGEKMMGLTDGGRLLHFSIASGSETHEITFMTHMQHIEPVVRVDTAVSRPLIGSQSQHVVILWNYRTKKQELRKHFDEEILSFALHPSGLFLALGFKDFSVIFTIVHSGLSEKQRIVLQNCTLLRFSTAGHFIALVRESVIEIYSFLSEAHMHHLDGHAGLITCMDWRVLDSVLVSCDDRGVTCEWDLTTGSQNWEHTAIASYKSVATNSAGEAITIESNHDIVCLKEGVIKWKTGTKREYTSIIFDAKTGFYYAGTTDGCLVALSLPSCEETEVAQIHRESVTAIAKIHAQSIIVSSSIGGLVSLTRIGKDDDIPKDIYSKLILVERAKLRRQQEKSKQTQLTMEYFDNMGVCQETTMIVNHEKRVRQIMLELEKEIDTLNDQIFAIKEAIQRRHLEGIKEPDETALEKKLDEEVRELTRKLGKAYKKTTEIGDENTKLRLEYEATLRDLNADHAMFVTSEKRYQEEARQKMRKLENDLLVKEQDVIDKRKELENVISQENVATDNENLTISVNEPLASEKQRLEALEAEIKRLKQMTLFWTDDTTKRRKEATGQIDYDIQERRDAITYLKTDFQKLESSLGVKEKFVQIQEEKFSSHRTLVSSLRKKFGVAKTALEELNRSIRLKADDIEFCRLKAKAIQEAIPGFEEELEVIKGYCDTVDEKVVETAEGLKQKQKKLRETQEVLARYTTMLHRCLSREYDLKKLVGEILKLFEDSRVDFTDEEADPRLNREFVYQIEQLKRVYEIIKSEPEKAARDKATAEFRLSQENSKILKEVHDIQKEDEKLRTKLNSMEGALLLQIVSRKKEEKPTGEDMRSKMEFVATFGKRRKFCTIEELDKFIEEQQKELARFQTMLAAREAKKQHGGQGHGRQS